MRIRRTSKGFVIMVEDTAARGPAIHAYNTSLGNLSGNILDLNNISEKEQKLCRIIN